jgi:tetratricopeptide (TPR) repeat protein
MFNIFSNTIVKVGHFLVYTIAFQTVLFSQTETAATRARLQKIYEAYDNEKIKEGLKLADEGIVQSIATKDSSSVVALSQMKSKFFRLNNEIENAMNSLIYGMKYATKPADKIKLNHQIGEILLDIGAYNSAVPYLEEMVNTEKNPMSKFYHCNLLGQAYLKSNKKEKCIKVFEKQLEIAKTLKEEHFVINANNNLGFVLLKFKEFEAAKKHLNFVVNTLSKKEKLEERDQIILTNALITLSQFYYQLSDYKQGVVYFEKAEAVAQGKIDGVNVNKSYFYSLLNTGQLDKATQLLQRLRKQADDDASRLMLSSYFMEYYSRVKKYDLLANEIKKHDSLEINVRAEIEQSNQKNLDLVGDFYVSSAENHLNLEENKYQKLTDQKESAFRLYIISILGGLLILIVSIYLFYEKQRRTKLELQLIEKEKRI